MATLSVTRPSVVGNTVSFSQITVQGVSTGYKYHMLAEITISYPGGSVYGTYCTIDDDVQESQRLLSITIDNLDYTQTYNYTVRIYTRSSSGTLIFDDYDYPNDPSLGGNKWAYANLSYSNSFTTESIGQVDTLYVEFESEGSNVLDMPDDFSVESSNGIFSFYIPDNVPRRIGHKFLYWTDPNGQIKQPNSRVVLRLDIDGSETYTYTAVWEESEDDGIVRAHVHIKGDDSVYTKAVLYDSYVENGSADYSYAYRIVLKIYERTGSGDVYLKNVTIDSSTSFDASGRKSFSGEITGLKAGTTYAYTVTVKTRVTGGWATNSDIIVVSSYSFTTNGGGGDPYVHLFGKVGNDNFAKWHKAIVWLFGLKSGEKIARWHKIRVWVDTNSGNHWKGGVQ